VDSILHHPAKRYHSTYRPCAFFYRYRKVFLPATCSRTLCRNSVQPAPVHHKSDTPSVDAWFEYRIRSAACLHVGSSPFASESYPHLPIPQPFAAVPAVTITFFDPFSTPETVIRFFLPRNAIYAAADIRIKHGIRDPFSTAFTIIEPIFSGYLPDPADFLLSASLARHRNGADSCAGKITEESNLYSLRTVQDPVLRHSFLFFHNFRPSFRLTETVRSAILCN